jgi:DNA-binding transcriptional regulator GbsR (MarR family)
MPRSPKEQFIELIAASSRGKGFDELSSKVIGVLYLEPKEVALDELAKRTGYSLSAVSTAMKFMERAEFVQRIKKPGSRKVYFYMEKDLLAKMGQMLKKQYEKILLPSREKLPEIITQCRTDKSCSPEELSIMETYQKQLSSFEKVLTGFFATLGEKPPEKGI